MATTRTPAHPLGAALDAVLPLFAPPVMSADEAQAIAACVASCDEPVEVPLPASCVERDHLVALVGDLNRSMSAREMPVKAHLREAGVVAEVVDGLRQERRVPAGVMVRRVGGR